MRRSLRDETWKKRKRRRRRRKEEEEEEEEEEKKDKEENEKEKDQIVMIRRVAIDATRAAEKNKDRGGP